MKGDKMGLKTVPMVMLFLFLSSGCAYTGEVGAVSGPALQAEGLAASPDAGKDAGGSAVSEPTEDVEMGIFIDHRAGVTEKGPERHLEKSGGGSAPGPDAAPEVQKSPSEKFVEEEKSPESNVVLNFDNADIYQVIRAISEILEINYVIDPAVKGTVNVHTKGRLSRKDLFGILTSILKVNGAAAVREGEIFHIVPAQNARTMPILPITGEEAFKAPPSGRVMIQIVKLRFVSASDAANILKPFVTPGAEVTAYEKNNLILIADFEKNIKKMLSIIDLLDVNFFDEVRLRLYPLVQASVEDVAEEMQKIFSAFELPSKSARGVGISFVPVTRINSLLVISSLPQVFNEVEKWLEELDHRMTIDEVQTYIYHVKNGVADELAEILNLVFTKEAAYKEEDGKETEPPKTASEKETKPVPVAGEKGLIRTARTVAGEVKVIPYPTTNTIIIKATPRDYSIVKEILDELDIMPRQVMIEILIAEVTLNDENLFGIEFSLRGREIEDGVRSGLVGTSLGLAAAGTLASGGLTASIIQGDLMATLNALASESRVNILASPHIIASDGKEASIDIGDEVPLIASKIFVDQREEVTIERRDTGILLTVTPHINTTGLVTLDVSLELSDASKALVEGESDIRIFQRNAKTNMVVQDGQTVVIGGLIDEKKEKEIGKVPLLGDLPFIGLIFRSDKEIKKKTELLLLITPRVIHNLDQANDVTVEFLEKLKAIKENLKKEGKLPPGGGA